MDTPSLDCLRMRVYTSRRDIEVDYRTGWTEIHKAMVSLRVQRKSALAKQNQSGAYEPFPNQFEERLRDFAQASAQLRGQLERVNNDPLVADISALLDGNEQIERWQTDDYEKSFDALGQKVAMKAAHN